MTFSLLEWSSRSRLTSLAFLCLCLCQPLLITQAALAHADHYKDTDTNHKDTSPAETDTPADAQNEQRSDTPSADEQTTNEQGKPSVNELSDDVVEASEQKETSAAVADTPTLDSQPGGLSLGLSESVVALVVAGPILLFALKKRLQSR